MRKACLQASVAAVVALSACGDAKPVDPGSGSSIVAREVHRQRADGPTYIEGAVQFLEVTRRGQRGAALKLQLGRKPVVRTVGPGDYRVVSYTRSCSASCTQQLDAPSGGCHSSFSLGRGERKPLAVETAVGRRCLIRVG